MRAYDYLQYLQQKYKLTKVATLGKPKKDPTPEIVDHCAARIVKEKGLPKAQAYRICVGRFQQYGILRKGTMQLTQKGKRMSQKHYKHRRAVDLRKYP